MPTSLSSNHPGPLLSPQWRTNGPGRSFILATVDESASRAPRQPIQVRKRQEVSQTILSVEGVRAPPSPTIAPMGYDPFYEGGTIAPMGLEDAIFSVVGLEAITDDAAPKPPSEAVARFDFDAKDKV
ncbi:hypothetical protein MBLNU230_g4896t1 [Neophaeotheca triangularis]